MLEATVGRFPQPGTAFSAAVIEKTAVRDPVVGGDHLVLLRVDGHLK